MKSIGQALSRAPQGIFVLYAGLAAFSTYSCMYAYRKAFSVGVFEGLAYWGMDYKSLLIIAQVLGYMSSKFLGIKVISEMQPARRGIAIVGLIALAELALLAFAWIPPPYNIACLFLNGLPLGMIWGLVFSFLEGRRTTELLGAILTLSFILANNIAKSVAQLLLNLGISEFEMPWLVGLLFALPLCASVLLLSQVPPPTTTDEQHRVKRIPMNAQLRRESFGRYAFMLVILIVNYMLLTAYRDLQSNFASNIWQALGYADVPEIYLSTSLPVTLLVSLTMGLLYLVKDNFKALLAIQATIFVGMLIVGLSTLLFEQTLLSGEIWIVLIGTGTYMAYIPFNCFLFERTIAAFRIAGNAGFFMYLADSFGYLGSVATLVYKNFFDHRLSWYEFTIHGSYFVSFAGAMLALLLMLHYLYRYRRATSPLLNLPLTS